MGVSEPRMNVTFWGTRGSISTPGSRTEKYGGNTPCVSVQCGDEFVILDAGTGIRNLGLDLARQAVSSRKRLQLHLFLSHTHWDHIQGLPFFAPAYMSTTRLTIHGSPSKKKQLKAVLEGQMDVNYFPVEMKAFTADINIVEIGDKKIEIGPITVEWQEQVHHPGGCVRYKLVSGGRSVVYATDVDLGKMFGSGPISAADRALGRQYLDFVKGADLLISDGQYTEKEYESKQSWGHSCIDVLLNTAMKAKVKQLAVFHHDPQHSDAMLDKLWMQQAPNCALRKRNPLNVFWAREGMTIAV